MRRQILVKILSIEFPQTSCSVGQVVPCGQTDVHGEANSRFSQLFWERAKKNLLEPFNLMWQRPSHQRRPCVTSQYHILWKVECGFSPLPRALWCLVTRALWCLVTGVILVSCTVSKPSPRNGCGESFWNSQECYLRILLLLFTRTGNEATRFRVLLQITS